MVMSAEHSVKTLKRFMINEKAKPLKVFLMKRLDENNVNKRDRLKFRFISKRIWINFAQ